jgi:acetyltransferase-like isoleucine patch superfamily enzyme
VRLIRWLYFHCCMAATYFLPDLKPVMQFRGWIIRPALEACGRRFLITHNTQLIFPHRIRIGNNVFLAHGVWMHGAGGITIGDDASIGPYTVIVSTQHEHVAGGIRQGELLHGPIHLKKGAYIGSHVVILKNVTLGENAMVAPGSVISRDVPDNAMAVGNPARVVMRPVPGPAASAE